MERATTVGFMNLKPYKKLIAVFLLVLVVFGSNAIPAFANDSPSLLTDPGGAVKWGLMETINTALYSIMWVERQVLGLAGELLDFTMQPGPILTQPIVQIGWGVTRDFANMFFILMLLAIALSYILYPSFQAKQVLPKFFMVAFLINFSLPVAGLFLDASNVFTNHFLGEAAGADKKISYTIAQNLWITKANDVDLNAASTKDLQAKVFTNALFSIVFLAVTIFVFFALSFMMLIRLGYIYILLILLPLALLAYIWPSTQGKFGMWTSKFFQWTFFPPVATFFIYLSMKTYQSFLTQDLLAFASDISPAGVMQKFYDFIVIIMLLLGSLYAAQQMSITGAGASMKMLQGAGKAIRGAAWRGTKRGAGAATSGAAYGAEKYGAGKITDKAATLASKIPIVGGYGARTLQRMAPKLKAAAEKRGELTVAEKAAWEKMSSKQRLDYYKNTAKVNSSQASNLAKMLSEKGELKVEKDDTATLALRKQAYADAVKVGNKDSAKAIEKSDYRVFEDNLEKKEKSFVDGKDPNSGKTSEELRSAYYQGFKPIDVKTITDDMLKDGEFMNNMIQYGKISGEHLKAASKEAMNKFLASYNESLKSITATMDKTQLTTFVKNNQPLLVWQNSTLGKGVTSPLSDEIINEMTDLGLLKKEKKEDDEEKKPKQRAGFR